MAESQPDTQPDLLVWCAILGQFDTAALVEIARSEPADIQALLASTRVEPVGDAQDTYRLREDVRRASLAQLRRQRPHAEIDLHTQAYRAFLQRIERAETHSQRLADEDRCFEHLDALHDLYNEHAEWDAIIPAVDAARKIEWQQPRYLRWLELYEADVAARTDKLDDGIARFEALLVQPDLEPALRLRVLYAYGAACSVQPRYDAAQLLFDEANRLALAHGDLFRQAYIQLLVGMNFNDLDDFQQAWSYSEQSLQLFRQIGADYGEAHALYEIGNNAMRLGDWDRARTALDESAAIYAALGVTNRLSMPYWVQGMVYQMLGDEAQSEIAYLRALAIAQTPTYSIPSIAMDSLAQLSLLYQMQGLYDEASSTCARAIELTEQYGYLHWRAIYCYRLGELLRQRGRIGAASAAYREAISGVEELRSDTEIETIKINLLGTTQYIYESMVLFCLEHETPALAFEYVERARARAFLDILAQQSPDLYSSFDQPTATIAEVQSYLAAGDLLVEYFTTGVLPHDDHWLNKIPAHNQRLRQHLVPPAQIIVFAITRESLEVHQIAVDPNKLRPSLHSEDPVLQMLRIDSTTRWLYDRLIKPVEHLLPTCRQLFVIPHGPLHYVPFTALRAPDATYLLKDGGPAVVQAPSATILLRSCLSHPPSVASRCLAIGYNNQEGQPLEHAETEAQFVARLTEGEYWTGTEPKSQRLLRIGPELRWLHIASHATYHHEAPLTSSLLIGAADALNASTIMGELKLRADLVTLSSCMSGFSRVVPGDELLGLQRAFLYAGAPTVVCTLAKTHDTVAALVMEQFYTRLLSGATAAAALRDALVAVRTMPRSEVIQVLDRLGYRDANDVTRYAPSDATEQRASEYPFARPEYWAPFMLIGRP